MSAGGGEAIVCETTRLILRRLKPSDLDFVAAIMCDPEVMRFSIFGPETREGVAGYLAATQRRYERDGVAQWAVVLKESREGVGLCGICTQLVDGTIEHELGYRLARPFWGRGLATEAAAACRDYGFEGRGLNRLVSIVQPENQASVRVAEKIGMRVEKEAVFYGAAVQIFSLGRADRPGG